MDGTSGTVQAVELTADRIGSGERKVFLVDFSPYLLEAACVAIVEFLRPSEFSHGWLLLACLQTLSPCSGRLADMLSATALPSTIVKSFYLFFDLPAMEGEAELSKQSLAAVMCEVSRP